MASEAIENAKTNPLNPREYYVFAERSFAPGADDLWSDGMARYSSVIAD
jgi:hypothetical protein